MRSIGKTQPVHGDPVLCSNGACGRPIGRLYANEQGLYLLQAGDLLIKDGQSMFCAHCGQVIHWSTNDQQLEKLLRLILGEADGNA